MNVNLDMLDLPMPSIASEAGPEVRRSAGIYTMMEHHVANADIVPDCDSARPKFESMHKELKALCGDIVAIEIADRIGLNKRA